MRLGIAIASTICIAAAAFAVVAARRPPALKLAPGWKIELIAEAPGIVFPTAIVTAPDGRIFLGQDPMDMPGPATSPIDSVVSIVGSEVKVFASDLYAVMGLEWVDDSLIVVHAPYLSRFRDRDGDGHADERIDLVTGLGPAVPAFNGMNDHIASGVRLGIDGCLYLSVGDKGIPRAVGRDGATIQLHGGGVIRVRPDGTGLEVVSTGERNPLSVALTDTDEIFTYGNDDDSKKWPNSLIHHIVGGHYGYPYEFLAAPDRALAIMKGQKGGAGAQGLCYNDDGLANRFRGNLFFCDWGRGMVTRYQVEPSGGTYRVAAEEIVVRRGTLSDFRPFSLAVGEGGACFYVVDWACNGFLVDGPKTGRLFRLAYDGRDRVPPAPRPRGDDLATELQALEHPALSVRLSAQRQLARRGGESETALVARLKTARSARLRVHALWALDAIGTPAARGAIDTAIIDDDPLVRAQAARSAGIRRDMHAVPRLICLLADTGAPARREAAIALGRINDRGSWRELMASLGDHDAAVDWSIRHAIRGLDAWDVDDLARALLDENVRASALKLCDETWSVPVARALVKAIHTAKEPACARASCHCAGRTLSALSRLERPLVRAQPTGRDIPAQDLQLERSRDDVRL